MATGPADIALGTPVARFPASGDRRPDVCSEGRGRRKGRGDRLHLQSLPLCEGRDRPARRRRPRPPGQGNRLRRHLLERRLKLYPEDSFPKMAEFAKRHDFAFPYLHD